MVYFIKMNTKLDTWVYPCIITLQYLLEDPFFPKEKKISRPRIMLAENFALEVT